MCFLTGRPPPLINEVFKALLENHCYDQALRLALHVHNIDVRDDCALECWPSDTPLTELFATLTTDCIRVGIVSRKAPESVLFRST